MPSVVEIANGALAFLGDSPIISLDDNTNRAALCKTFYPFVRDYVLRGHPWKCAVVRYSCALLAEVPVFGFSRKYQLPDNCLRVLGLEDEGATWNVEGKELLTDSTSGKIVYIKRVDNPGEYDPMLTMVMMITLAMMLASAITEKAVLLDGLSKLQEKFSQSAKSVNAQEGSPQAFEANVLVDVR